MKFRFNSWKAVFFCLFQLYCVFSLVRNYFNLEIAGLINPKLLNLTHLFLESFWTFIAAVTLIIFILRKYVMLYFSTEDIFVTIDYLKPVQCIWVGRSFARNTKLAFMHLVIYWYKKWIVCNHLTVAFKITD